MSHKILYLTLIVCAVVFFEEASAKGGVGKTSARRKIMFYSVTNSVITKYLPIVFHVDVSKVVISVYIVLGL